MMLVAKSTTISVEGTPIGWCRLRDIRGVRRQVRVGASDPSLTAVAGIVAVTELVSRLRTIESPNSAVGPIKQRNRGHGAGELLVGLAAVQLAGEDFLVGVDRHRGDTVGQVLTPVPDLVSTTAAGLAHRFTPEQWVAVETGVAAVSQRMLALLPAPRAAVLTEGTVTIDIDAPDVEVYGRKKRGVDYNHVGQRCGRPHVASWAEAGTVLAAELLCGRDDPRSYVAALFRRALAALPAAARNGAKVAPAC